MTDKEAKELAALATGYDQRPDVGVKTLLSEAKELGKSGAKDQAALVKGTDLAKGFVAELERRSGLLDRAEDDWDDLRARRGDAGVAAARAEVEGRRRAAFRALRYFLRGDAEVQARLDEIAEGGGDADLVDDAKKLGNLLETAGSALAKAKLPKNAADGLRSAGEALAEASSDVAATTEGGDALGLRNRAFWYLRESMDEARAAARYVFSDDPRRLSKYRSTSTLMRKRARPKKAGEEAEPATS